MFIRSAYRRLKTACNYWVEDHASQFGAALAYYTLFSVAPLLIIAIGLASQVYGKEAAQGHVLERIRDFIGEESAGTVQTLLASFRHAPASAWATIAGFVALWLGALALFSQLRISLHRIWRLQPRPQRFFVRVAHDYLLAFIMVLVASIIVLLLLAATTTLTLVSERWGDWIMADGWTWRLADFLASFFLVTLLLVFTFRLMSDGLIDYRHLWGGSLVSAILFTLGKMAIGFYLGYTLLASAYGVAGSLVVFLAWVYYSAQIFYFGAEIIRAKLNK
jgi:membrane protein